MSAIIGAVPRIQNEAPAEHGHRHTDFCAVDCDFCGETMCRDQDDYGVIRVGDTADFVRQCEECHGKCPHECHNGRIYNNADTTSNQWFPCPRCAGEEAA